MQKWEVVEGSLASAQGFRAAATAAGIKKALGALDLALIVSDAPETKGCRPVHDELGGRGAGDPLTAEPCRKPWPMPRRAGELRQRQRLHGSQGHAGGKGMRPRGGRTAGSRTRAGSGGLDGSHRSPARRRPGHGPTSRSRQKPFRCKRAGGRARHHDHRLHSPSHAFCARNGAESRCTLRVWPRAQA